MESKDIMELVDRIVLLTEEYAKLRVKVATLKEAVESAELENARNKEANKDADWVRFDYTATLPTEQINMIMGWRRAYKAEEIIERLKGERNEG